MDDQHQATQEIDIYDDAEVVLNSGMNSNGHCQTSVENNLEGKLHYTNLDATSYMMMIPSESYMGPTNYHNEMAVAGKDYIFGAPANVLYKNEVPRNFPDSLLGGHHRSGSYLYTSIPMGQPIYESPPSGGGPSPSGQPSRFPPGQSYYNFEGYNVSGDNILIRFRAIILRLSPSSK